jgi:hypothetical protein
MTSVHEHNKDTMGFGRGIQLTKVSEVFAVRERCSSRDLELDALRSKDTRGESGRLIA